MVLIWPCLLRKVFKYLGTLRHLYFPLTFNSLPVWKLLIPETCSVQKQDRVTFKAVDEKQKLLGFATWNLPQKTVSPKSGIVGLPEIPGVNMQLWNDKVKVPREFHERDVDPKKDMRMYTGCVLCVDLKCDHRFVIPLRGSGISASGYRHPAAEVGSEKG